MAVSRPLTSRTAHPPPRFGLPPPTLFFVREGGGRSGRGLERKRPMEAPKEGRVGGLCGRTGEGSANGRAPHIPGSRAPPLATHVLAGRAQGHARLVPCRAGRAPTRMVGSLRRGWRGRPRAAIVACSGTAYVRPDRLLAGLARVRESGAVTPRTPWNLRGMPFNRREPRVRLVQARGIVSQIIPFLQNNFIQSLLVV